MANYNSIPQQFNSVQPPLDVDFMGKVLMAKEGQTNANIAQIDETLGQLKIQENMLIGDKRKARFANNVQTLLDEVNKSGKLNLQSGDFTRRMKNYVTTALDDYTLDHIAKANNIRAFQADVAEKKKKGDGSYSAINVNDALELAGASSYINEQSDNLGTLQYQDYVNAPKEINDAVAKWAKDNGYQTEISSEDKGLYFINTKREILTKDEILNYIDVIVDPKIKSQMDINTRQSYGKLSDEKFKEIAKNRYEFKNTVDSAKLAELQAKKKTLSGDELKKTEDAITNIESRKKTRLEKINSGNYDRNDQYDFYKDDLYGNIAEAYDRNNIVDIDYNTTALEIAKFKFDVEYKTKDLALKEKANKIAQGESLGTAIPVIPEDEPTPKSNIQIIKDNVVQTEADLKNILSKEDPEYRKLKTLEEQNSYVRELMKNEGVVNLKSKSPLSNNIITAINNHKNNYKAFSTYINTTKTNLDNLAVDQYNDMLGARGLDLNNLGSSMPFTASFLKNKKTFDKLSSEEQDMVKYERALGQLQFDSGLSDDERATIKTYTNRLKVKNTNNKWFQQNIKALGDTEEIGGSTKNFWTSGVYGVAIKGAKNVFDDIISTVKYGYESTFGSTTEAQKELVKDREEAKKDWEDISKNYKNLKKSVLDSNIIGAFYEDTNITEVDTSKDTKSGNSLSDVYKKAVGSTVDINNKTLASYLPNIAEKQSFSFSTESKAQEPTAIALRQIVEKHGEGVPGKGANNFNLEYFAQSNAFKISYLDKDGELQVTPMIDGKLMPANIVNKYQTSLSNWSTDLKNPKALIPNIEYSRPIDRAEGENMIATIARTNPDVFTDEELYMLMDSPMFQSPTKMYDIIYKAHPELKNNPEKQKELNTLMNATIKTRTRRYNESTFQVQSIFLDANGNEIDSSKWENIGEYDSQNNLKIQLTKIGRDFNEQVSKIIQ